VARLFLGFRSSSTLGSEPKVPKEIRIRRRKRIITGLNNKIHNHFTNLLEGLFTIYIRVKILKSY
jgi:hypothetical protein